MDVESWPASGQMITEIAAEWVVCLPTDVDSKGDSLGLMRRGVVLSGGARAQGSGSRLSVGASASLVFLPAKVPRHQRPQVVSLKRCFRTSERQVLAGRHRDGLDSNRTDVHTASLRKLD